MVVEMGEDKRLHLDIFERASMFFVWVFQIVPVSSAAYMQLHNITGYTRNEMTYKPE